MQESTAFLHGAYQSNPYTLLGTSTFSSKKQIFHRETWWPLILLKQFLSRSSKVWVKVKRCLLKWRCISSTLPSRAWACGPMIMMKRYLGSSQPMGFGLGKNTHLLFCTLGLLLDMCFLQNLAPVLPSNHENPPMTSGPFGGQASLIHRDQLRGLAALLLSPVLAEPEKPQPYEVMSRIMRLVAWTLGKRGDVKDFWRLMLGWCEGFARLVEFCGDWELPFLKTWERWGSWVIMVIWNSRSWSTNLYRSVMVPLFGVNC